MNEEPEMVHVMLDKYTESLCTYASYQIQSGAQIMQVFESWYVSILQMTVDLSTL